MHDHEDIHAACAEALLREKRNIIAYRILEVLQASHNSVVKNDTVAFKKSHNCTQRVVVATTGIPILAGSYERRDLLPADNIATCESSIVIPTGES